MRVKICGITTLEQALAVCAAGADALGFNFAEEAKARGRYVAPEVAREIVAELPPYVTSCAVCVNPPEDEVREWLKFLDIVQFHGEESPELVNTFGARSIKVFRVGPAFGVEQMRAYRTRAWLLDAYAPDARGGTGKTFNWDVAKAAVALGRPVILAGGLTPENVEEAVRVVRPFAVDTAGGVESAPGIKDIERVRKFIENARHA